MTSNHPDRFPDDLAEVAELLRSNRPEATALELDGVKRTVLSRRAARTARGRAQKGSLMKSRFAMMAMLVVGMLMSTTGAGLAVSGLSSSGSAGIAQYGQTTIPNLPCDANGDGVVTETEDLNGPGVPGCDEAKGDVLPESNESPSVGNVKGTENSNGAPAPSVVQPTRQVEAGADTGGELPFTGFAAIPVLLGGIALLAGGLVLRRRTAAEKS